MYESPDFSVLSGSAQLQMRSQALWHLPQMCPFSLEAFRPIQDGVYCTIMGFPSTAVPLFALLVMYVLLRNRTSHVSAITFTLLGPWMDVRCSQNMKIVVAGHNFQNHFSYYPRVKVRIYLLVHSLFKDAHLDLVEDDIYSRLENRGADCGSFTLVFEKQELHRNPLTI